MIKACVKKGLKIPKG